MKYKSIKHKVAFVVVVAEKGSCCWGAYIYSDVDIVIIMNTRKWTNKYKCKSTNSNRTQNPHIETITLDFRQCMHERKNIFM